ncbi:MAG: cache domain-containing protein [Pseudomonadota bacterium]
MTRVRLRLLVLALLPLVVLMPILLGFTMTRLTDRFDNLLIAKVASDLRVAEQYFLQIEEAQALSVAAVGQSARFQAAQTTGGASLEELLERERARLSLDFLIYGSRNGQDLPEAFQPALDAAVSGDPSAGLILLDPSELDQLAPGLAERARIQLVPTAATREIDKYVEDRGMILLAAYRPETSDNFLLGGRLLNGNLDITDTMNALVYRDEGPAESRTGTTTLFLEDVRISTNVRLFEGARALGTRVSEVVWRQVMGEGEPWLNRAFVVTDWYISGYVPLSDLSGERIGMLYTGFLEEPFTTERDNTILTLILAFLAVLCLTVPLFLHMARGVFTPLERMSRTMDRFEEGELDARIGHIASQDEIGEVARHLDQLLDQVQERDEALRQSAEKLNDLVETRTAELREANEKLEATFAQLVIKEKLASLGEVTAGVAHEINNPIAVIQGNVDLLRDSLPAEIRDDLKTELNLIDAQVQRINVIVGKLLNFSKPGEMSDSATRVDVRHTIEDALLLVAADLRKQKVQTQIDHQPSPKVTIVETELQQVLVNLFINAAQAMTAGGTLTVESRPASHEGKPGTEIVVADTGSGIPQDKLDHVFDPFFTTKRAKGTGLGLSISHALIERAGGLIYVKSEEGRGTKFFVWFPATDNLS